MPEIKHSTEAIFYYWIFGLTKAFSNGHIGETKEETEEEILKILIQLNSKKIMNGFIGRLLWCSKNEESIWKWLQLANESNSFYWIPCQDEIWEYSEFER